MTARPVSPPVLLRYAQAAATDGYQLVVLRALPAWPHDNVLQADDTQVRIAPVISPLAARDAVVDHLGVEGQVLVLLSDRNDLGRELLARAWRGEPVTPTSAEACKRLFQVDGLHRHLAEHRWLLDLLVDVAPRRGYPPPPGGILDLETAWRTALRHALDLEADRPDLPHLLRWAQRDASRSATDHLGEQTLQRMAARLAETAGPAASHVIELVKAGRGGDTVALGLVCGALWGDVGDGHDVVAARTRLEERAGLHGLSHEGARDWARAAHQLVEQTRASHEDATVAAWIRRAEEHLDKLQARDMAAASEVLPAGFEQRLSMAGKHLSGALTSQDDASLAALTDAVSAVQSHLEAERPEQRRRVQALEMALRLARGQLSDNFDQPAPADLREAAAAYRGDGAYVDRARDRIDEGETVQELAAAYGTLVAGLDQERRERDRSFAAQLSAWTEIEPLNQHVLPIESLLDRVLTPIAEQAPTLLLVVDGLSWDTAHQILDDIAAKGWMAQGPGGEEPPAVVATFPTVTRVSRASMLCGQRTTGAQKVESEGFTGHGGLTHAANGQAPVLFHKGDLQQAQGKVAPEVRKVVTDPAQRVVGVVVNAVDDHLDKGGQLTLAEGLDGIAPLHWLLRDAAEAGRVVVLTSDHGHVHEHGTEVVNPRAGGGERWRPDDGDDLADTEVRLSGPRVLDGDGSIVAAATEEIRYQAVKKNGYHGGATPAEVLCPLAIFTPGDVALTDYEAVQSHTPPAWWSADASEEIQLPKPAPRRTVEDPDGVPQLFAPDGGPVERETPDWLDELLDSPLLEQQRQVAGRAVLDIDDLTTMLLLLTANNDVMTRPAIAQALELPVSRVQGKTQALKQMLNVDMYDVVKIDADGTVRLQRDLLFAQFGISQ